MSPKAKKRIKRLAVSFAFLYFALQLLSELFIPTSEVNYRLDVTFEVDGVPVTGSGVQKLVVSRVMPVLGAKQADWTVSGEAVIIDLPGKKSVFVLMASPRDDGSYSGDRGRFRFLLSDACQLQQKRGDRGWAAYVRFVGDMEGQCRLLPKDLPLMVAFEDEADPSTVKRIFPDHPESVLGKEVKFLGAILTITHEQVTKGIRKRLTWLSDYPEPHLVNGDFSSDPPFSQILQHGFFRNFPK